jgi:hypothetical protein
MGSRGKSMDETPLQYQAAQFRVALLLKQYKFGAASAAKYLGKSRGLVQSWMQIGNKHFLAKEKIKLKSFEKIVKRLRRVITQENIDYFLAMHLLDLDLPVAFIGRTMNLPISTVRSWKHGKIPSEIKKFFFDKKVVDNEFNKLLKSMKSETTRKNLEYFLALHISKVSRGKNGHSRIGGRTISQILTQHFILTEPIPEKTVSCWIDGKRKPWDAFTVLADQTVIKKEYNKIVNELTLKHMPYHISILLVEEHGWNYGQISDALKLNKELVRGWVKKNRGNPIAKTFVNQEIVKQEVDKFINSEDIKMKGFQQLKKTVNVVDLPNQEKQIKKKGERVIKDQVLVDDIEFNLELEQELIYHLETIPTGVTSGKVLKSILIDHSDATIEEIEAILANSKEIIRSRFTGKWILKKYDNEGYDSSEATIENDLAKIDCERHGNDEIICKE